jgi:hypothetical protein
MLSEYKDIVELSKLPKSRSELSYYLSGFADAEGCFSVALKRQEGTRFGFVLDPVFHVTQHKQNRAVLELYVRVLGCGRIIPKPGQPETLQFYTDNRRQLSEKILPFFRKYRLIGKDPDFQKFARIVEGLENKEHANKEKFVELVKLAFQMNLEGKQRRYELDGVLEGISQTGSSETIRQTPGNG